MGSRMSSTVLAQIKGLEFSVHALAQFAEISFYGLDGVVIGALEETAGDVGDESLDLVYLR